jgi:osmotically-inducible protein OsmY
MRLQGAAENWAFSPVRNFHVAPSFVVEADFEHDQDLSRRVRSFLNEAHMPGLRNLAVEASNGIVTVSGLVKTYYEKQLGGMRARRVAGVVKLIDQIRVASQPTSGSTNNG